MAVLVNGLSFSYKSKIAVENLDLSVPCGRIYGLLGPAGCGKSTVIRCILGIRKPTAGRIRIFGKNIGSLSLAIPGQSVGYMPQDLALSPSFTIEETLRYYANILQISSQLISQRINYLIARFDLPEKDRLLGTLSGGQQRRVSLCVALLHQPKLLLLDEPTVGVDPLLRHNIWVHLQELCNGGTTVLITTCLIEEAMKSGRVGLMRGGKMLVEDAPDILCKNFDCDRLEDVFLKLCLMYSLVVKDIRKEETKEEEIILQQKKIDNDNDIGKPQRNWFNTYQVPILVKNNAILTRRNFLYVALFYLLLPSLIMASYCIGNGRMARQVAVGVVNEENPADFTEQFLSEVNDVNIRQEPFLSLPEAVEAVKEGRMWAALYLSENFTKAMAVRAAEGAKIDDDTLDQSMAKLYMDMSNPVIDFTILYSMLKSIEHTMEDFLIRENLTNGGVSLPWTIKEVVYGSEEPNLKAHNAPAILAIGLFFVALTMAGFMIIQEKTEGLLERKLINGIGVFEILFSHLVNQSFIMTFQLLLLLVTTYWIFEIQLMGSLIEASLVVMSLGVSAISFSFFLASIFDSAASLFLVSVGINFCFLVGSGIIWPVESMPVLYKTLASMMPITMPVHALRCITTRGWSVFGVGSGPVAVGIGTTLAMAFCFFGLSVIIFRRHIK